MAGKSVEGLSWLKAQRTAPAIQTLRSAYLAIRMVTGDNHRTAISVARECGIVSRSMHVFFPVFSSGDAQVPNATLTWSSVDDEVLKLDDYSLKPLPPPPHHSIHADTIEYHDYTLAVPGDVFRWMINNAPLETLQRVCWTILILFAASDTLATRCW